MARALSGVVLVVAAGCALREAPALRACASGVSSLALGPSSGTLRVIPSRVPGMEIDTATWMTFARTMDLGVTQGIEYRVKLRSTDDTLNRDVALLYQLRTANGAPTLLVDDLLVIAGTTDLNSVTRDPPPHTKGQQHAIISWGTETHAALATGLWSSQRECPVAVRLIPAHDLALYGQPGASASDNYDQLVARLRPRMSTTDTGVLHALVLRGSGALGVMAENATDTVLTDMVIALVIDPVKVPLRPDQTKMKLDTFEFFLARIAPRELITRTGGSAVEGSVVTAVTYPAERVVGRRIGGAISRMPRITRVDIRPSSRAEEAGMAVLLIAEAYDTVRRAPRDYDDFPAHWTVWSSGARAYLTDTTSRRATVHAEHEGLAHVSATIGGVTGSADINFTMDQRSVTGPGGFESFRRVLPDGSIEYLNLRENSTDALSKLDPYLVMRKHLCTIQPGGKVRYASWLRPWAERVRANMAEQHAIPDSARLLLERLTECKV